LATQQARAKSKIPKSIKKKNGKIRANSTADAPSCARSIRLSAEPGNTFGQDEFSQWHIDVFCKMRRKISTANCPGATTIKPQRVLSMHDLKIACKFWP